MLMQLFCIVVVMSKRPRHVRAHLKHFRIEGIEPNLSYSEVLYNMTLAPPNHVRSHLATQLAVRGVDDIPEMFGEHAVQLATWYASSFVDVTGTLLAVCRSGVKDLDVVDLGCGSIDRHDALRSTELVLDAPQEFLVDAGTACAEVEHSKGVLRIPLLEERDPLLDLW